VGATILDNLLVGIIAVIVLLVLGVRGVGLNLGEWIFLLAYQILLLGQARGQTVGNMALGTKVVDANTGNPIGYGRAAIRAVVLLVLDLTLILGLLSILWPLWDRRNQTWHDKAANTLVIRLR
jgi:uncharacterized RDD family membrane protein YckC